MYSKLSSNVLILSLIMPLLATFAVALRLRARSITKLALGADDYTILSATVTINGLNIFEPYSNFSRYFSLGQEVFQFGPLKMAALGLLLLC